VLRTLCSARGIPEDTINATPRTTPFSICPPVL
jgi:hypothetical protein